MSTEEQSATPIINGWYELFSRGSRDWLRHSEKVREAVREHLPQIVAGADIINPAPRPCACRCACWSTTDSGCAPAAGQRRRSGQGQARRRAGPAERSEGAPGQKGAGGTERGGIELMLEFKVDDIIDWLWEELQLPNLQTRVGPSRRRTGSARAGIGAARAHGSIGAARCKEAVKRRAFDAAVAGASSMRICATGS